MGRDGARPSRGEQMVRHGHWNFDWDLEGTGPSAPGIRWDNVLISRLQGTAALQVNDVFQGGMASLPSQFSPCYNYKG